MKSLLKITFLLSFIIMFFGCKKDDLVYIAKFTSDDSLSKLAFVKFFHLSPNFPSITKTTDNINLVINRTTLVSSPIAYNGFFPSALNNYVIVNAGNSTIDLLARSLSNADTIVKSWTFNFEAGKYYTIAITDSIFNVVNPTSPIINDIDVNTANQNKFKLRIAHLCLNDTVGKKIDVYSVKQNANLFTNIAIGQVSEFKEFNFFSTTLISSVATTYNLIDSIYIRRAGTNFNLAGPFVNTTLPFIGLKSFTLFYRGNGNLTTGTRPRGVFLNSNN